MPAKNPKEYRQAYKKTEAYKLSRKKYKEKRKNSEGYEKDKARQRAYHQENKEKRLKYLEEWRQKNPDKVKEQRKKCNERRRRNPLTNFADRIRQSLRYSYLKRGLSKKGKTFCLLPYEQIELYNHLSLWLNNNCEICNETKVCLDNSDIDHIIPLHTAQTELEILSLNNLENLRLICHNCNIRRKENFKYTPSRVNQN